jgi:hypothetical protein
MNCEYQVFNGNRFDLQDWLDRWVREGFKLHSVIATDTNSEVLAVMVKQVREETK